MHSTVHSMFFALLNGKHFPLFLFKGVGKKKTSLISLLTFSRPRVTCMVYGLLKSWSTLALTVSNGHRWIVQASVQSRCTCICVRLWLCAIFEYEMSVCANLCLLTEVVVHSGLLILCHILQLHWCTFPHLLKWQASCARWRMPSSLAVACLCFTSSCISSMQSMHCVHVGEVQHRYVHLSFL